MRIRRSVGFILRDITKTVLRRVMSVAVVVAIMAGGALVLQNTGKPDVANAITPPDSCFNYTTNLGQVTITDYYDNEGDDGANPICPRAVDIPGVIAGNPVKNLGTVNGYPGPFTSKRLTAVTIPNSVTLIGRFAFFDNTLTAVNIPSGVTTIGYAAFSVAGLTSVTIPNTVTTIDENAFTSNKLTSVTIPSSVTTIGSVAFGYNSLTTIVIAGNPGTLGTEILEYNPITSISYNGTTYTESPTTPEACFTFSSGTITNYKLYDLNLIKSSGIACMKHDVTIPSTIGGNPVTSIGGSAFYFNQLTAATVPSSVISIGDYAFSSNKLSTITVVGDPSSLGVGILYSNPITSISYNGTTYTDTQSTPEACYDFSAGTITGYKQYDLSVVKSSGSICNSNSIVIPSTIGGFPVTSIGNDVFDSSELTSVTIPFGVTSIGDYAFSYNQLPNVTIPNSVTTIGESAFLANKITTVSIPNSVTSISPTTFAEQNPWGEDIESDVTGVPYLWSSDPVIVQQAYDSIWYVRLYTADPSNPGNIQDGLLSEAWWQGSDANSNGTQADSLGGHIVNPARTTVNALDRDGTPLQAGLSFTGTKTAGGELNNYNVVAAGAFAPLDPYSPTGPEQTAMNTGFAQYNRIGQTKSFTASTIAGYTLLSPASPASKLLSAADNTVNFTYAPTRGSVDFGTAGQTPAGVAAAMVGSVFAVDDSKACSVIRDATLLPSSGFTAPAGYTTLGGLDFTLDCTTPGTEAAVSLTLGQALSNLSGVRVYKKTVSGTSSDITSRVSITNENTADGLRTVVRYGLADGGTLDDDGIVNGSISDPIYVVVPSGSDTGLAATGVNVLVYVLGAGAMVFIAGAVLFATLRDKKGKVQK